MFPPYLSHQNTHVFPEHCFPLFRTLFRLRAVIKSMYWSAYLYTSSGYADQVSSVAFSPDGQRIVSGSRDKTVRIWGAGTGATLFDPLEGRTHWVWSVAFSPDSRRFVSGSGDITARVWDA